VYTAGSSALGGNDSAPAAKRAPQRAPALLVLTKGLAPTAPLTKQRPTFEQDDAVAVGHHDGLKPLHPGRNKRN